MFVSRCPRCQEEFRLPAGPLPEDAQAICPWCQEQFPLAEVTDELPPMLKVLYSDGTPIKLDAPAANGWQPDTQPEPVAQLEMDEPFAGDESSHGVATHDWTLADPAAVHPNLNLGDRSDTPQVMPVPMHRRRNGSGIRTAIGVVLGGLAALPIAGGLLILLGRTPDWGFWPFDGGNSEPGPGIVAAPTGSFGDDSNRRTFGQSLMEPDDTANNPSAQDAAIDAILGRDRTTRPTSELPSESERSLDPDRTPPADDIDDFSGVLPGEDTESIETGSDSSLLLPDDPSELVSGVMTPPTTDPSQGSELDLPEIAGPSTSDDTDPGIELPDGLAASMLDGSIDRAVGIDDVMPSDATDPKVDEPSLDVADIDVANVDGPSVVGPNLATPTAPATTPAEIELPDAFEPRQSPASEASTAEEMVADATAADAMVDDAKTADATANGGSGLELPSELVADPVAPTQEVQTPTVESRDALVDTGEPPKALSGGTDNDPSMEMPLESGPATPETKPAVSMPDPIANATTDEEPATTEEPGETGPRIIPTAVPRPAATTAADSAAADSADAEPTLPTVATPRPQPEVATEPASVAQLAKSAESLLTKLSSFQGSKEDRRRLLRDTYLKVVESCDDAMVASPAIDALAQRIGDSPILSDVEEAGLDWIRYDRRKFEGVAVIGQASEVDGKPTLTLNNGNRLSLEWDGDVPQQAKVLTLGRILDENTIKVIVIQPLD